MVRLQVENKGYLPSSPDLEPLFEFPIAMKYRQTEC
jgi:hypothetical protein